MAQETLSWNPNTEADLAGYEVYRNGTKIATVLKPTATYVDTTPVEGSNAYDILAFDTASNKSAHTAPVTVTVNTIPPAVPTGLVVVAS